MVYIFPFTATSTDITKQVKLFIYMVTNQLEDNYLCYNTIVKVFSREVDINKWEIVCVVLDKHGVSRKCEDFTHVFINTP